uniref:Bm14289 n=1 Tax=Brugia malayi TaxID=6279 RepID=A0A1I9G533_BRUMA|nr:Bm14289 [Brugia malayi]
MHQIVLLAIRGRCVQNRYFALTHFFNGFAVKCAPNVNAIDKRNGIVL